MPRELSNYYENIEFTLDDGQTDYDLDANESDFLTVFGPDNSADKFPEWVEIRTDQTISVKLNLTTNDSITITSTDVPYVIDSVRMKNMFLTNGSGTDAAVKLRFQLAPVR